MTQRPRSSPAMKEARKLAAQRQAQAEMDRRRQELGRIWCRLLQTWKGCAKSLCRRRRDCNGDARDCFERHWSQLPEEAHIWFRARIRAQHEGLDATAAAARAREAVVRWRETQARLAAQYPDRAPETPPREAPMPRIRVV
jgi:hypothetical protein